MLFLAAEPLTDKIVWDAGNAYTFRLRTSTYMQTAMLDSRRRQAQEEALGDRLSQLRVRPVGHGGVQEADEGASSRTSSSSPSRRRRSARSTPAPVVQALADAKPDAIFSSLFGADLAKFVREGQQRGLFKGVEVFNLLAGEPEYLDPLKEEAPDGWYVTGYPWSEIKTPEHKQVPRRLPGQVQGLPAAGLGGRLLDRDVGGRRDQEGGLDSTRTS